MSEATAVLLLKLKQEVAGVFDVVLSHGKPGYVLLWRRPSRACDRQWRGATIFVDLRSCSAMSELANAVKNARLRRLAGLQ